MTDLFTWLAQRDVERAEHRLRVAPHGQVRARRRVLVWAKAALLKVECA